MPDPTPCVRIAALVGSHTVVRDGRPVSVYQAVGGQAVDDIAAAVADEVVAPLEAERDRLRWERDEERAARRTAAECADRFRDVLAEALGYADENPGDDTLVATLREHYGRTGAEPTRWRDFLAAARAQVDQVAAEPMRIHVIDLTEEDDQT